MITRKKKKLNNNISKLKTKKNNKTHFYYSFLTIVLLICVIQVGASALLNITKVISYQAKISTMKKIQNEARDKNMQLRKSIDEFSSTSTLEEIARNNLKMAGDDEVLVIINKNKTTETPAKNQENKKVKNGNR